MVDDLITLTPIQGISHYWSKIYSKISCVNIEITITLLMGHCVIKVNVAIVLDGFI